MLGPYYFDNDNSVIIGAPAEAVGGIAEAGQVSVLVPNGSDGIGLPDTLPPTLIEDDNFPACGEDHRFTYYLGTDREYGSAFSFASGPTITPACDRTARAQ